MFQINYFIIYYLFVGVTLSGYLKLFIFCVLVLESAKYFKSYKSFLKLLWQIKTLYFEKKS